MNSISDPFCIRQPGVSYQVTFDGDNVTLRDQGGISKTYGKDDNLPRWLIGDFFLYGQIDKDGQYPQSNTITLPAHAPINKHYVTKGAAL